MKRLSFTVQHQPSWTKQARTRSTGLRQHPLLALDSVNQSGSARLMTKIESALDPCL